MAGTEIFNIQEPKEGSTHFELVFMGVCEFGCWQGSKAPFASLVFWHAGVSLEKLQVTAPIVDPQPLGLPFPYFRVL